MDKTIKNKEELSNKNTKKKRFGKIKKLLLANILFFTSVPVAKAIVPLIVLGAAGALGVGSLIWNNLSSAQLSHNLRLMEAWGIYYGQMFANTIHTGGIIYGLALIMFLWGLYRHLMPTKLEVTFLSTETYIMSFFMWLVYFGIMFLLIGQPWNSKFNLLRMSTSIADHFTNDLIVLFNGNSSATAAKTVSKQITKLAVNQVINIDTISPSLGSEISDFIDKCATKKNGTSNLGVLNIANANTDALYTGIKSYNGLKVIDCAQWKKQLREEISQSARNSLYKIAQERHLPKKAVLAKAKQQGKEVYDKEIIPTYNDYIEPTAVGASVGAGGSWGPPTENEELAAYALTNSNISSNIYEKLSSDAAVGYDTSNLYNHSVWWYLIHPGSVLKYLNGGVKRLLGGMIITLVQFIPRIMMTYLIEGIYAVNSILYAFVIMFLPLVAVLCLGSIVDIVVFIRYLFVLIWVKSWVVPISILMNLYTNYLNAKTNMIAPLIIFSMLLMVPSIMAIIILQGNALITKISTGVESAGSDALRMVKFIT